MTNNIIATIPSTHERMGRTCSEPLCTFYILEGETEDCTCPYNEAHESFVREEPCRFHLTKYEFFQIVDPYMM